MSMHLFTNSAKTTANTQYKKWVSAERKVPGYFTPCLDKDMLLVSYSKAGNIFFSRHFWETHMLCAIRFCVYGVHVFRKTFKKFNLHQADNFFMISKRLTFLDLLTLRISFDKPISSSSSSDMLDEFIPSFFNSAETNFNSLSFFGLITNAFINRIYLKYALHTTCGLPKCRLKNMLPPLE